MIIKTRIFLVIVLFLSLGFRLIGLNWDQNQHFHPDERFLTMVGTAISWPGSLFQYFDTQNSPANPHNQKFDFYVYGTYPVLFVKAISLFFSFSDYQHLPLVGRAVSALLDTGIVLLVFLISRALSPRFALWSAFVYSISVLPIQLSHFFAVDPYLVFFITLSFYLFVLIYQSFPTTKIYFYSILLGLSFGLALGAKISGIIFLPTLCIGFILLLIKSRNIFPLILCGLLFIFFSYTSLRFSQPYLFARPDFFTISLNSKVLENWKLLSYESQPNHYYPPSTQWVNLQKGIFPLINLINWGLGFPLAAVCLLGIFISPFIKPRQPLIFLISLSVLCTFIYQSFQFSQPLRYFYPIYPFLAILGGILLSQFNRVSRLIIPILLIWPLSFVLIYTRPHSRVTASEWIYKNIPSGSRLSCDYWDDCLPVSVAGYASRYNIIQIEPYSSNSPENYAKFISSLSQTDYLVISSNRLYGSITSDSEYYPQTSVFYRDLFNGKLGFTKLAEFTSRPNLPLPFTHFCITPPFSTYGLVAKSLQECPLPGLSWVDDYADETFTVYDHPKVLIFKKTSSTFSLQSPN